MDFGDEFYVELIETYGWDKISGVLYGRGMKTLYDFAKESNEIEGIYSETKHIQHEKALRWFLDQKKIGIPELQEFVFMIQPDARLRTTPGMNVWIAGHPGEDPTVVETRLLALLQATDMCRYKQHVLYEMIHPFTDGNGRSGRALWLWRSVGANKELPRIGFLHAWYYKTLEWNRGQP